LLGFRTTGVATAILALSWSDMTYAVTWQSAIAVPSTVEYDSNPLLLTSDEKGVTRTIIAPDYSLVGTSGRDEFQFGLGVNIVRSSDTSIVSDREDPRLRLGWQRETETMYLLGGNWSTALSERSTLVNETDYTHVTYDVNTLTNYDELATRFSWNYAWSEQVELFTRLGVRRYEPEKGSAVASSNSYTPAVGLNVQLSERLKGTAYVGLNQVSGTGSGPKGQGGLMLQYAGERIDTSIDASRSTLASGDGGFVEVDALRGTWSYAVDETRRTGFDVAWQDAKGRTPNTLQNYSAWFSQELSPFWIARLSYTYKQRQQDGLPDATANVVGLTLTYSYPGL
jgi:hypothetical protein